MENSFKDFLSNITLTSDQQEDAQTKYTGVCEKLYKFTMEKELMIVVKSIYLVHIKPKQMYGHLQKNRILMSYSRYLKILLKNMMAIRVTDNALCFKK